MAKIVQQISGTPTDNIDNTGVKIEGKIYQFGIQAPQYYRVVFNGDTNNRITIGATGIFQADLDEGSYISSIAVILPEEDSEPAKRCYIDVIMEVGS